MLCNKLLQGFLTVCLMNLSVAEIPAIAIPLQPIDQTVAQATNQLTEPAIRQILENMKMARENEDVAGMLKYIAPFAYTEVIVETEDGTIIVDFQGKDDHRKLLESVAQIRNASKSLDESVEIEISEDGKYAIAKLYSIQEITTSKGEKILTSSNDIVRFGLIDNQPMVVSAKIKGWLAYRPAGAK